MYVVVLMLNSLNSEGQYLELIVTMILLVEFFNLWSLLVCHRYINILYEQRKGKHHHDNEWKKLRDQINIEEAFVQWKHVVFQGG